MSRALHCRPSALFGIPPESLEAYALDSAVTRWGVSFEAALSDATSDAKDARGMERARQRVIRRWLPSERRYADPRKRE